MGAAAGQGWTSPSLPYLKSNSSELPITDFEGTWIASILDLGSITGNILSPVCSNFIGRKYLLLNLTLIQIISWVMIVFANQVITLYIARFLIGLAGNAALNFSMMYVGEIAGANIRGKLLFLVKLSVGLGFLAVKTAGAFLPYHMMNITMLMLAFPFFFIFPFIPESPYYLLTKNRREEAVQAIKKLQGSNIPKLINSELDRVQSAVKESQECKRGAVMELFFNKGNRKCLYIVIVAMTTTYLSGRVTIAAFTQEIMSYSGFFLAPEKCTVIIGVTEVLMIVVGAHVIEILGRKTIFLFSSILAVISLGSMGLFFFMKFNLLVDVTPISWVPFVCLIFYGAAINLGISTASYVLLGEMFALNVKVTAISLTVIACDILVFTTKILFQWINTEIGIYANFWMYAIFASIGALVFFLITPETKGKSLEEIQNILHGKKECKF